MVTKEHMKFEDLTQMRADIDSIIQERAKSSGMVLASVAVHTPASQIRALVKPPNDDSSEAWPFG